MIATVKYLFLVLSYILVSFSASAQMDTSLLNNFKPPLNRQLFHGYVDAEQKNLLRFDGKADSKLVISSNEEVNFLVTKALTAKVDWLQYQIEKDSLINHARKIHYLRSLESLLKALQKGWREKQFSPVYLPATVDAFDSCMQLDKKGLSIENYIYTLEYSVATPIVRSSGFDDNSGIKAARNELIRKYCLLHPEQTFYTLKNNPDVPFADTLVRTVAQKYPQQLYDYAQANSKLGNIIRNIDDNVFIKSVTRMATSKSGQQYFPFLDNIVKGKMTFEQIDEVKDDSIKYYKLLVKTQMDYMKRALNKDTAYGFKELEKRIETKARDIFVNTINALHEIDNPAIRFKIIQPLTAEELYYLAVTTDGIIYTSSFVKGVYPLMMAKANQRGDSLLINLKFDKYRKFIKMCAGYNTLNNFLSTFQPKKDTGEESDAERLMRAFVGKLEESEGLEDGVDVADSYASIGEEMKPIANQMLINIKINYDRNLRENNKRGIVIYNLLYKLFLSASDSTIDLSKEFGIPAVYSINYKSFASDSSGQVVMQSFFYGDEDGRMNWAGFIPQFSNNNWKKIEDNKYWVAYASAKGKPILVYANKPLDEESGELDKAQEALNDYLLQKNIQPTIVVHRGHSYWVPTTISYIRPAAKIVYLGSCGGYNLIHDVLNHAPDAHIIASKQTGKIAINQPFFNLLLEKMRNGKNIDWVPFWKEFEKNAGKTEGFEDYIPPYKNLGAIFIKAYKIAMGDNE
jgi:hypothetical protein